MKTLGMMAVNNFPLIEKTLPALAKQVDHLVLRFDLNNGDPVVWSKALDLAAASGKLVSSFTSATTWNRWNWREELLEQIYHIAPNIVLFPDEDEILRIDERVIKAFYQSRCFIAAFDYKMITADGRPVEKYPKCRHVKMFKWMNGITYQNQRFKYRGYAQPSYENLPDHLQPSYPKRVLCLMLKEYVEHYCFFTPEMEEAKRQNLHK